MAATNAEPFTLKGWHVLAGMIAFFGVIFAVNGVFLAAALSTHTGIVSKQPYRKGIDYNDRIAAGERQQALGWSADADLDTKAQRLLLKLMDRNGRPVTGLMAQAVIGRPATEQFDLSVPLLEAAVPGTYDAQVGDLAPGSWLLQIEISEPQSQGSEIVYRLRKRLWLKH